MKKQTITATFLLAAAMFIVSCGSKTSEKQNRKYNNGTRRKR